MEKVQKKQPVYMGPYSGSGSEELYCQGVRPETHPRLNVLKNLWKKQQKVLTFQGMVIRKQNKKRVLFKKEDPVALIQKENVVRNKPRNGVKAYLYQNVTQECLIHDNTLRITKVS